MGKGGTTLFGLEGQVPLNRVGFHGLESYSGYTISLFSVLKSVSFKLVPRAFPLEIGRGCPKYKIR